MKETNRYVGNKTIHNKRTVTRRLLNFRPLIILPLIIVGLIVVAASVISEEAVFPDTFTLGEIPSVLSVQEGELLNFSLSPPVGFGTDVQWTITSPDLSQEELSRIFSEVPAFPGAEGFGINARGGRGGRVIKVTNLNTSGPGSLAEALLTKGPRIIVFDVSGVIEGPAPGGAWLIAKSKRFYAAEGPVTIAGQTAPGAGITLSGQLVLRNGDGGTAVDNVIARFLRIRDPYYRGGVGDNLDGPGNMAVFDHISGAWGVDENFDFSDLRNASIQWCGIEESAGYGDEWEVLIDKDNDGMLDYWEQRICDYDSSDAIKDYILHVLPDGDLDSDGQTNIQEYRKGSNPLVAGTAVDPAWTPGYDSDKDGMFDWWEQKVINSKTTDALKTLADIKPGDDLDGDLSSNLEEHNAGTSPLKGPEHNYGMIMGYDGESVSLHHNFFAHHHTRAPLSGTEVLDHRNNVIYNIAEGLVWHPPTMNRKRPGAPFKANVIGNFFKVGPNSLKLQKGAYEFPFISGSSASIYGIGNYFDMVDAPTGYLDIFNPGRLRVASLDAENRSASMYKVPKVKTYSAEEAYKVVLAHAGSWPRDAVTLRNIEEIKTRTGKWGKSYPSGGLLQGLTPAPPQKDSDADGMPDAWEMAAIFINGHAVNRKNILNSTVQDHNKKVRSGESVLVYNGQPVVGTEDRYRGYTYIEYYLNELADQYILNGLLEQGLDASYLPGYGLVNRPSFAWVPGYGQSGEYPIQITASDGSRSITQSVKIRVAETNRNPYIYPSLYKEDGTLVSTHQTNYLEPGRGLSFEFYIYDPDGQSVSIQLTGAPEGVVVKDTGRTTNSLKGDGDFRIFTFNWYPTLANVGWKGTIGIAAKDDSGGTSNLTIAIAVRAPAKPVHTLFIETNVGGTTNLGAGSVLVQEGDSKNVYVYAEDDHRLANLIVDGSALGRVGRYSFSNITSDHSIRAVFESSPGNIGGCILDLLFKGNMKDTSIYGNDGVADAGRAPVLTSDRFGVAESAYEFNGASNYIRIADDNIFDGPAYTIFAWVYPRKDLYKSQYFISKNTTDGSSGVGAYAVYDSLYTSGPGYPHSKALLRDRENQWLHMAVSRGPDGKGAFYINGENVGNYTTNPNEANQLDVFVGSKKGEGSFFQGAIDDVQIYNRALTSSQIRGIFLASKPNFISDPPLGGIKPPNALKVVPVP